MMRVARHMGRSCQADAGPGVRYASPFGLVRIDFAYQLNRLEGLRIDGKRPGEPGYPLQ